MTRQKVFRKAHVFVKAVSSKVGLMSLEVLAPIVDGLLDGLHWNFGFLCSFKMSDG